MPEATRPTRSPSPRHRKGAAVVPQRAPSDAVDDRADQMVHGLQRGFLVDDALEQHLLLLNRGDRPRFLACELADSAADLHPLRDGFVSGFLIGDEVRQHAAVQLDVVLWAPCRLQPRDELDDLVARLLVDRFVQEPLFGGKLARARLEHHATKASAGTNALARALCLLRLVSDRDDHPRRRLRASEMIPRVRLDPLHRSASRCVRVRGLGARS